MRERRKEVVRKIEGELEEVEGVEEDSDDEEGIEASRLEKGWRGIWRRFVAGPVADEMTVDEESAPSAEHADASEAPVDVQLDAQPPATVDPPVDSAPAEPLDTQADAPITVDDPAEPAPTEPDDDEESMVAESLVASSPATTPAELDAHPESGSTVSDSDDESDSDMRTPPETPRVGAAKVPQSSDAEGDFVMI